MERIEIFLSEECELIDLENLEAPYFPRTFTHWREFLFKEHSPDPLEFAKVMDNDHLVSFLRKVNKRYYHDTIRSNQELKIGEHTLQAADIQQDLAEFAGILASWSTELELAVDIIERAQLYGIYTPPEGLRDIYSEMKNEWASNSEALLSKLYRFLLKTLAYGTNRLTSMIKNSIAGVIAFNLESSKTAIVASAIHAYIGGVFPWPILALLGTQLSWMASSWVASRIGGRITDNFDHVSVSFYISELKEHFQKLLLELIDRNETSRELIFKCLENGDDKETAMEELSQHLNAVLLHKTEEPMQLQKDFDEDEYIASHAAIEDDGEWIKITMPQGEFKQVDDWMTLSNL